MAEQIECVGGPLDGSVLALYKRRIWSPYAHENGWVYAYRSGKYVFESHVNSLTFRRMFQMFFVVIWFKIWPVYKPGSVTITIRSR